MKLKVAKEDVWAATIKDRPGGLNEKLEALTDKKNAGVDFVTPVKGARREQAAKKAGFKKSRSLHSLRVDAADKPGLGAALTRALADAGINLRGLSAAAIGRKSVMHLAFDKATDAAKAARILKKC